MANGGDESPTTDAAAADTAPRPQLGIQSQYVKDLSFENPGAPESLVQTGVQPEIKINVEVQARTLQESIYEVSLHLTADGKSGDKQLFVMDLLYGGVFTITGVPQDSLQLILLVECPRMLFPFARRVMADASRDGGFPPLMLSPIDFLALFRDRQEAGQAENGADSAEAPAGDA